MTPETSPIREELRRWFEDSLGSPYPFQEAAWRASARGHSGLIHVPTGAGKTYAAYLPALSRASQRSDDDSGNARGLAVLYISPLRAMSRDLQDALIRPIEALPHPLDVETRTGDTSAAIRRRQKKSLPRVLVTTPESLSLLLTYSTAPRLFADLQTIIVDEWHELIHTKRGTQVELAIARLRRFAPDLQTWALTATLSNVDEAAEVLCGEDPVIVGSELPRPIEITTALPPRVEAFSWAGHLGLEMLPAVLQAIESRDTTLLFTNTRSQAERWFQALQEARPAWAGELGLHHGSIDQTARTAVEAGLKSGALRAVVSTSSLDLGVDFAPVDQVIQIGSVKGIARLIQRAGRSGHRPGETCRILCVPTQSLHLVEFAAARQAVQAGELEPRRPLRHPLDVLAQHMVTCALGGGFVADEFFDEVRAAYSYRDLSRELFDETLELVCYGGDSLRRYERFQRVEEFQGRYIVQNRRTAQQHRSSIGTIAAHPAIKVRWTNRKSLGTVEESFITRLRVGDHFFFAGQVLELVSLGEHEAFVKKAPGKVPDHVPRWMGGRLPLSTSLSRALRDTLDAAARGHFLTVEVEAARPLLELQANRSAIPHHDQLLVERLSSRESHHLFLYPFEGRLVHEGLAALLALRLGRRAAATFSLSVNEYGVELMSPEPIDVDADLLREVLHPGELVADFQDALNVGELSRRQFRSVARVAGLVFDGYPGSRKSNRQLQTSAGLLYDVFARYDPEHLLMRQTRQEVLELHFQESRLHDTLQRLIAADLLLIDLERPSPLGFPLLVDRQSTTLSTETLQERIQRMKDRWLEAS